MGYVLSPRARADIEDIWSYTAEKWGGAQAESYILGLKRGIETIARDPRRGRPCDDLRPGYRKFAVGSHILFFRLVGDDTDVVRVLHQSMDFEQHLWPIARPSRARCYRVGTGVSPR